MQWYVKLTGTWLEDWRSTTTTTTTSRGNSLIFVSQSNCKIGVIKVNSTSLGGAPLTHHRAQSDAWLQLWRASHSSSVPISRAFDTETRAGHLHGRNRLGQILHLPDFNNIWDPNSLLTRGLPNSGRLDTRHTKPLFRGVPSILPANHDNIIRLFRSATTAQYASANITGHGS